MKMQSSKMAISVTASSKPAAIVMPAMLSAMNTMYAPSATHFGSNAGNCTLT